MKNIVYLLLMMVCGCWCMSSCTEKEAKNLKVIKQVSVAVKTANLRKGPGTRYDMAPAPDGNRKWQVNRGTVLNVVATEKGWYQVFATDSTHTAYIKQSLCSDYDPSKARRNSVPAKKGRTVDVTGIGERSDDYPAESSSAAASSAPNISSSSTATEDDFEEEVEEAPFLPKAR